MAARAWMAAERRPVSRVTVLAVLVALAAASAPTDVARCATRPAVPVAALPATTARVPAPSPTPARPLPSAGCPYPESGFWCAQQRRFAVAERYLATRPGVTAVVVRNRVTGATWRNAHTQRLIWTASTIKLAIAVDLLLRERARTIVLRPSDRTDLAAMLRTSNDNAATRLWNRYGGSMARSRYAGYGLTGLRFPGRVYWGAAQSTADDMDRLINHVLDKLPPDVRAYIVKQLREVAGNQQWGVWGAGPAAAPGNKNGWHDYGDGWVINSVGFVGPGELYTVTLMNDLGGEGGYVAGVQTTTKAAELLFAGRF